MAKNRYKVPSLSRFDPFKIYRLGSKALLVIQEQAKAYLLDQK